MEDKQLTTEQSLDLIARMIATTRRNFNDRGGAMFLIWGYTAVAVSLAVFAAVILTESHVAMWLWCAIPVIGGTLTWRSVRRHPKQVKTHLDKSVVAVWRVAGGAVACCMIASYVAGFVYGKFYIDVLFSIALLMSMATAVTGRLINFNPVHIGGLAGIAISFVVPAFAGEVWQMLPFAAVFLVAQVIPGHLLDAACKRERAAGASGVSLASASSSASAAKNGRAE